MKTFFGISVIIFLVVSCQGQQKKSISRINELDKEYAKAKGFFKTMYVDHFPEKIDSTFYISHSRVVDSSYSSYDGMEEEFLIVSSTYKNSDIIIKLSEQAKAAYSSDDTCLLVLNRFYTKHKRNIKLAKQDSLLIDMLCYENKLPIPNFRHDRYGESDTPCKLSADFKLYVLNAESGIFFQPKDKYPPNRYMPRAWKHGYSKGIAVSEEKNVAIYWIVIW